MHVQIAGKKRLVLIGDIYLALTIIIIIANSATLASLQSLSRVSAYSSNGSSFTHDPSAGMLYIANPQSNSISVVDLTKNSILKNITLGTVPYDIKLSEDQLTLYVTDMHSGTISTINTTSNELIKQIPTGVHPISDIAIVNGTLYVADASSGKILLINKDDTIANTISVGSRPRDMEMRPDGQVLYVANEGGSISVVDLKLNKTIKEIDSEDTPEGLSFTKDGSKLFFVNTKGGTLSAVDAYKHETIKNIPVGSSPKYIALSPDERLAYVTNTDSNTVSVVDTREIELINEIPVGYGPYGIALSADGDLMYVSNTRENDVSVINTTSTRVIAIFPSGGTGPHQIVARKPDIDIIRTADNYNSSTIAHVFLEVADNEDEMIRGLMFRKNLPWNLGMLFVFYNDAPRTFWMKNTLIPLDMIFVDSNLKIMDIKQNVPPCAQGDECPVYPSKEPAQYVLEVNAGFVRESGIKIGDRFVTANELNKGYHNHSCLLP